MIIFKSYKERLKLLEYENEIFLKKIQAIESHIKFQVRPKSFFPTLIREDGWDLSYDTLKKKYRED